MEVDKSYKYVIIYCITVYLVQNLSDLVYYSNAVVQRYVQNPLLIGGYKFDLRLYVCVPSFRPLTIYLYREGLARYNRNCVENKIVYMCEFQ